MRHLFRSQEDDYHPDDWIDDYDEVKIEEDTVREITIKQ